MFQSYLCLICSVIFKNTHSNPNVNYLNPIIPGHEMLLYVNWFSTNNSYDEKAYGRHATFGVPWCRLSQGSNSGLQFRGNEMEAAPSPRASGLLQIDMESLLQCRTGWSAVRTLDCVIYRHFFFNKYSFFSLQLRSFLLSLLILLPWFLVF